MDLRLYDTRTRQKEDFRPAGEVVRMYVCGPTVYDYAHLGHAKSYIAFDVLRRYLEYRGWEVLHVQNFTDIEDSITKRAAEAGIPPLELAERFLHAFLEDMDRLKVRRAHHYPRVTEHVADMIQAIESLVEAGHAYAVEGEVYMRAPADAFGRLSGRPVEEMVVEEASEGGPRENPLDFALWKRPKAGEPSWSSPWGEGRPGWHVECTVLSTKFLGPTFDLHGGGRDLIYPHHESEELLARALGPGEFARHWMHNGFMMIESEPMSKSLGNFVTIRSILEGHDWEALRLFLLQTHYRDPADYSEAALGAAADDHATLEGAIAKLIAAKGGGGAGEDEALEAKRRALRETFWEALNDDLDVPRALRDLLDVARAVEARDVLPATAGRLYDDLCEYCGVLGLCEEDLARGSAGR